MFEPKEKEDNEVVYAPTDCWRCIYGSFLPDEMPCLICSRNYDFPCEGLPICEE